MNTRWVGFPLVAILPLLFLAGSPGPSASSPDLQPGSELYHSYDNEFKLLLPQANQRIGKEVFKGMGDVPLVHPL